MRARREPGVERLGSSFWLLVAGSTVFFTAQGMLFPVLPRYVARELGGGGLAVGVAVSSFALGAMIARPWGGALADRVGRRWVAGAGAVFWAAMVALYPVAGAHGGVGALVVVRALGGVGGGVLFVAMATIATDLSPPEGRLRGFGLFSASTLIGFAVGPVVGEAVLAGHRFGFTFALCGVLALAPAAAMVVMPDTRPPRDAADARWQRPVLIHPAARGPGTAMLLGSLGFVTFTAFVPLHAEEVGMGNVAVPLAVTAAVNLATRVLASRYVDRLERTVLTGASLVLVASSALTLALWAAPAGVVAAAVLNGLGNAFLFAGFLAMTVDATSDTERARAIGSLTLFSDLAISGGGAILGVTASLAGYRGSFALAASLALCALAMLVRMPRPARVRPTG